MNAERKIPADPLTFIRQCNICGGNLKLIRTDLPFKRDEKNIVMVKDMPVYQCDNCPEYLVEDSGMEEIESILSG